MKNDQACLDRFLTSYEIMVNYYGCTLDRESGRLSRGEDWEKRYKKLSSHSQNFSQITRILKSMGELGLEHLKKQFLIHLIEEIWKNRVILVCGDTCRNSWVGTIKGDGDRNEMKNLIFSYSGVPLSDSEESDDWNKKPLSSQRGFVLTNKDIKLTEEEIELRRKAFRELVHTQSKNNQNDEEVVGNHSLGKDGGDVEDDARLAKYMQLLESEDSSCDDDGDEEGSGDEEEEKKEEEDM
eukprot:TRINITY_DN1238_c0_g1_i4.p1 TRINITY_DN1238_c0_g1~~TRINITY_DN1238_c0_g1_i4.p1  ORF type:complete len:239 (+),score=69.89 TRINITY_DN1238_c0_g1_i4:463-1179(+)